MTIDFDYNSPIDTRNISCVHTITKEDDNSVLSMAASQQYLFSGSQGSKIHVWSLDTFQMISVLEGHCGSVLGLAVSPDQKRLFSCSGDGDLRIWDIDQLKCIHIIRSCQDVGDIFSLVFAPVSQLLLFGCQNTSIQWYDFDESTPTPPQQKQPNCQKTQFFQLFQDLGLHSSRQYIQDDCTISAIKTSNVHPNAHDGYVYCMICTSNIPNLIGEVLITGSGDGNIKIWAIRNKTLQHHKTLTGCDLDRGILCLAVSDEGYLFCGVQGGHVQIWDLETYQMIRCIEAHSDDVLSIIYGPTGLISASADGSVKFWSDIFNLTQAIDEHNGNIILSMVQSKNCLITGSSDHSIKIWNVASSELEEQIQYHHSQIQHDNSNYSYSNDLLLNILGKWISIPSISGQSPYMEECRRAAKYIKNIMQQLGASTSKMIPNSNGKNPLVYAKFSASQRESATRKPTVLFYGHYDVMPAENKNNEWSQDPFKLSGLNGYLYGRGTSDNKGPIVSSLIAVHELLKEGLLDTNVIFLIEGEEECGSNGFLDAVAEYKDLFEDVDLILLSNSYWLGEDVPCITYGMRGIVRASITVSNSLPDLHSGVEGGAVSEPLIDLVHVVGNLIDEKKRILVPGFYDDVLPITLSEEKLYEPIVDWIQSSKSIPKSRSQHSYIASPALNSETFSVISSSNSDDDSISVSSSSGSLTSFRGQIKEKLMQTWRFPTLTVHKVDVSVSNPTIISNNATVDISMRIVPNQKISDICSNFKRYVIHIFEQLETDNCIKVDIQSSADYWLGDPNSKYFKAAELAVEKEWNIKPLYIREGGSIPAVRWLEESCSAPAIHIPFGQSSDQAHLPNERIRLRNLHAGRRVLKSLLKQSSLFQAQA